MPICRQPVPYRPAARVHSEVHAHADDRALTYGHWRVCSVDRINYLGAPLRVVIVGIETVATHTSINLPST